MNMLWLVVVAALMTLVQVFFFAFTGLRKVTYRRYFSQPAANQGDHVELIEEIANEKLSPVPWLRVESRISKNLGFIRQSAVDLTSDEQHHRSVFFLGPYKRIRRRHHITCLKRGYYNLNSVTLTSGDLLGLYSQSRQKDLHAELVVYPAFLDPESIVVPSHRWQGDVLVRRWIQPDPFLVNGIREYRQGDAIRDVHWAATARTGALQVKTHDYTASPKIMLLLNVQLREDQWGELNEEQRETIEYGLSMAATLAAWAIEHGVETGFSSNGQLVGDETGETIYIPPRNSQEHLSVLLDTMARMRIRRQSSMQAFMEELQGRALRDMDIVVISPYWSDLLEDRAQRLRAMGNAVTYLPAERRYAA